MDKQHVDIMVPLLSKYLHKRAIPSVRQAMEQADDADCVEIANIQYKNPMLILLCSIFLGHLGVDRFLMADSSSGIVKLIGWVLCTALLSAGLALLNIVLIVLGSILWVAMFVWWIIDIAVLANQAYLWNYYRILDVCKITFFGDRKICNPYINEHSNVGHSGNT